jgi:signal peptidase I
MIGGSVSVLLGGLVLLLSAAYLGGYRLAVIAGGSMEPAVPFGSLALMKRVDPENLQPGEIIAFRRAEGTVLHRVVAVDVKAASLTTRGDANAAPDATLGFDDVRFRHVGSFPRLGIPVLALQRPGTLPGLLLMSTGVLILATAPARRDEG